MRWLLLSLLVGCCIPASGSQDYIDGRETQHIWVGDLKRGGEPPEWNNRIRIFHRISIELAAHLGRQNQHVYVYWGPSIGSRGIHFYTLGYSDRNYHGRNLTMAGFPVEKTNTGITLTCYGYDELDVQRMLRILHYGYNNVEELKQKQHLFTARTRYWEKETPPDMIPSIPINEVWDIALSDDPLVDSLLHERHYRNEHPVDSPGMIDYYLQDNRYHVYRTGSGAIGHSKEFDSSKYVLGADILVLDRITEIVGRPADGHFIFTDDSSFYYLDEFQEGARGPFIISGLTQGRDQIRSYQKLNWRRFVLNIDQWQQSKRVLFDTEKGLVISNYGELQDSLVERLAKNFAASAPGPSKPAAAQQRSPAIFFAILALLLLNVIALLYSSRQAV